MFGMKEGEAIEDRMVTKQIENAQRKVEAQNFDFRKNLLEFDDVANDQRKVIYEQRNELLESDGVGETVASIREDVFAELVRRFVPGQFDRRPVEHPRSGKGARIRVRPAAWT